MENNVDFVLPPLDVGVDGKAACRVDGEARWRGALLFLGRSVDDDGVPRCLLARLLGGRLSWACRRLGHRRRRLLGRRRRLLGRRRCCQHQRRRRCCRRRRRFCRLRRCL